MTNAVPEREWEPDRLSQRALKALDTTDQMPASLRECVSEYGFAIVHAFKSNGITDPRQIRQLVHECWMGARQPNQRVGSDRQSPVLDSLDWLLIQAGAQISAKTLVRVLYQHSMVIVPVEPSSVMVEASMDAVNHFGRVSKARKHHLRLKAAIAASAKRLWPHLVGKG